MDMDISRLFHLAKKSFSVCKESCEKKSDNLIKSCLNECISIYKETLIEMVDYSIKGFFKDIDKR